MNEYYASAEGQKELMQTILVELTALELGIKFQPEVKGDE